jgi:alpha-1,2-mannosyltransferase
VALSIVSVAFAVGLALAMARYGHQVDIDVYLMGGAHASSAQLYSLTYKRLLFTYPPFAAVVFVPLAQLSRATAQLVWGVANVAALVWLLFVSLRAARPDTAGATLARWSLLLVAPAMLLDPVLVTSYLGQVNLVIAALVVTDLGFDSKYLPKGLLTGIAAAIKLTPLIFIPWLFLTRQYRAAGWATGTFAVCGGIGYVVSPQSSWIFWTKDVFDSARAGGLLSISNQNLKSAAMRIAHGTVPLEILAPLILGVGLLGMMLAVWAYRASSPYLGLLACATTGLVISPITWSHHLVWIVPALCWLALAPDRPRYGRRWAVAAAVFFWAGPIWWVPSADRGLHEKVWELVVGDSFLWVMLASLLGVAGLLAYRRLRSIPPEPTDDQPVEPAEVEVLAVKLRPA